MTRVDQLAFDDYERAVRKAFWRNWLGLFTRQDNDLLAFEQIRSQLPSGGQHSLGLQIVCVDCIVGSAGRTHDFDRSFLPRQTSTKERWISIDKAYYEEKTLPPVELMKVDELYFVVDGHHRVSVARTHGQAYIDAYVTELDAATPLDLAQVDRSNCLTS